MVEQGLTGVADKSAGLSPEVEPVPVSPADAASIPNADDFVRASLTTAIAAMLEHLGHPPLVALMYPNGWRNADRQQLMILYDQCRRTFAKRENGNG